MRRVRFFQVLAVVGILSVFVSANSALARDRDGNRDSRSSGSDRWSSGSGTSGPSSSRSFSSGSSRSMSGSSSLGISQSSISGGSSRDSGGRSSQSFQLPSNSDHSVRSFSNATGNSGPSLSSKAFGSSSSRGSNGSVKMSRSQGSQTVARPIDGSIPGRDSAPSGSSFPAFSRGGRPSGDGNTAISGSNGPQTFSNGGNTTQFNRYSENFSQRDRSRADGSRSGTSESIQNRGGTNTPNSSPSVVKRPAGSSNNSTGRPQSRGNTLGSGQGDIRFGRPGSTPSVNQPGKVGTSPQLPKDKVEDFLQLRRGNDERTLNDTKGRPGSGGPNGALTRSGNQLNNASGWHKTDQLGPQKSADDLKKDADQAWVRQFGNGEGKPGSRLPGSNGSKGRDGKDDPRSGIVYLDGHKPGNRDWKFDKDFVDRNYKDWRKGSPDGKGGKGDYRDWSGSWKKGDRFVAADHIRGNWKHSSGHDLPFSRNWWNGHHHHDMHRSYWNCFDDRRYRPYHWWGWCSAPRLTTWVTFGWSDPWYWDYGPGEYISCNNGVIYVNGAWFEPAPVFYQRTLVLAQQAPVWTQAQASQIEWLPLGVFAIARDGVTDQNVLVQLAVTRDGVIGGNIFNQLTGESFPVQGMVDKQSQRAAWTYTDSTGAQIVMESSIFNLTQPAATGLIHYGPNNMQVMELVRLEDPGTAP